MARDGVMVAGAVLFAGGEALEVSNGAVCCGAAVTSELTVASRSCGMDARSAISISTEILECLRSRRGGDMSVDSSRCVVDQLEEVDTLWQFLS